MCVKASFRKSLTEMWLNWTSVVANLKSASHLLMIGGLRILLHSQSWLVDFESGFTFGNISQILASLGMLKTL